MEQYKCKRCEWTGRIKKYRRCLSCKRKKDRRRYWGNVEYHRAKARIRMLAYDKLMRKTNSLEWNRKRRRYRRKDRDVERTRLRYRWLQSGNVTRLQLIEIYERANGKCQYCGKSVKCGFNPLAPRGFDHVIPMAKKGKHTASNMVVSCWKCNYQKGTNRFYVPDSGKGAIP